jgi:predicted RNA-binding Zn-ribbon protein involved in translation (DUF1610 family)
MMDTLAAVRADLQAGQHSPQTFVHLFNAASEAEQRRDLATLEEARRLAEQLAASADETMAPEAQRLVAICAESVERVRGASGGGSTTLACPGCGREISGDAVRCRRCGTLLV